ncbi:MAG: D-glycero-beta-D-manno-heptose 1,7-bisphosphate 7-phosphatase [Gammaproteobacteria bacterium]|nr:MAG: D-glycero-beta-D-manno-heptose 1,7-bisphosphate 7-phosphatase [Gammaproteobacteria bacterium]
MVKTAKNPAFIILDRDGVINFESKDYIKTPKEWLPIPGSLEAISLLTKAGYTIAVATNQSGVGRGFYTETDLALIHQKMLDSIAALGGKVDKVFYCPHHPEDHCSCRKPGIGLFEQIADYYQLDLKGIFAIGDSLRDIKAALKVGCEPILVLTGNGEQTLLNNRELADEIPVFPDLLSAVQKLLQEEQHV